VAEALAAEPKLLLEIAQLRLFLALEVTATTAFASRAELEGANAQRRLPNAAAQRRLLASARSSPVKGAACPGRDQACIINMSAFLRQEPASEISSDIPRLRICRTRTWM